MRMAGVAVIDRDPIEPGAEVLLEPIARAEDAADTRAAPDPAALEAGLAEAQRGPAARQIGGGKNPVEIFARALAGLAAHAPKARLELVVAYGHGVILSAPPSTMALLDGHEKQCRPQWRKCEGFGVNGTAYDMTVPRFPGKNDVQTMAYGIPVP